MKTISVQGKTACTRFVVPESWQLTRHLGTGAYATVAAFQSPDGTELAVKKVERTFDHPVLALRTLREVRLLTHFQHPNILSVNMLYMDGGIKNGNGTMYLCLEAMDCDLNTLIHASPEPLSYHQIWCILYQILRGQLCLQTAHVVHRDLKPGNILIRTNGEAKIADFGLARAIGADQDASDGAALTEYVVTRFYRAPEVVLTATRYTHAVDMWSTGCILGEAFARRPLFCGEDPLDQIRRIIVALGRQSLEDMAWIPQSSCSWKFVEKCNQTAGITGTLDSQLRRPDISPPAIELLTHMLRFDPSHRISVEDALMHPLLSHFAPANDPEVAAARKVQPMDWSFDSNLCFDGQGQPKPYDVRSFQQAFEEACSLTQQKQPRHKRFQGGGRSAVGSAGGPHFEVTASPIPIIQRAPTRRRPAEATLARGSLRNN